MCSSYVPKDATAEKRISSSDLDPEDGFIPACEAVSRLQVSENL